MANIWGRGYSVSSSDEEDIVLIQLYSIWSHIPEHINPTLFSIGPIPIRWYGMLYLTGWLLVYLLVVYRVESEHLPYTRKTVDEVILYCLYGCLIGGRLGYVFLYDFRYFYNNPLQIFFPFNGPVGINYVGISGLSYHGSVMGILVAYTFFSYKRKINFWHLSDVIVSAVPLGYTLGRVGNFINGELYGRVTASPLGMYFPSDPSHQLRHPSQLYEAFFEGLALFVILWSLRRLKIFDGFIFSLYFIGYGTARFLIEFVRQPDPHLGLILELFTLGQILSLGMILGGFIVLAKKTSVIHIGQKVINSKFNKTRILP